MPKPANYPTLYDQCKKVSITFLKQHGYLQQNKHKAGVVTWSNRYEKTGSISISTYNKAGCNYLQLDYKVNGEAISYRVDLVSIPSNLGRGFVWYFICPQTGWHCRNLYLINGYFYHRKAFTGCMYDKQTESRKNNYTGKLFDKLTAADNARNVLRSKHFKKQYNGKPTKRYLKHLKQIEAAKWISWESLLMM